MFSVLHQPPAAPPAVPLGQWPQRPPQPELWPGRTPWPGWSRAPGQAYWGPEPARQTSPHPVTPHCMWAGVHY